MNDPYESEARIRRGDTAAFVSSAIAAACPNG